MKKKIAVLTSGGDAPGMNAALRSIVIASEQANYELIGYQHGFNGLLQQEYVTLEANRVGNLIQRGGTILRSARCLEFKTERAAQTAAANLDALNIDALIIIGGDGSFRGAVHLAKHWQGQIIGLPGTIDNDIAGTDATIGYYTAIETAVNSIDKVRDTADAFERIFLVEVMGRHAGFLALNAAIASASDYVILPELFESEEQTLSQIEQQLELRRERYGNESYIIVLAEKLWPGGTNKLVDALQQRTGSEVRPVILGHVQRGGSPVSQDRLLATRLGYFAVNAIGEGKTGVMIGERNGTIVDIPLEVTWTQRKPLRERSVVTMKALMNSRYA